MAAAEQRTETSSEPHRLKRLTEAQLADYERDGYLFLRGFFSAAEMAPLQAGDGVKNRIDPGPMVEGNGYEQPAAPMPTNWFAALERFRQSEFIGYYFGKPFVDIFATIKEIEADRFFAEPQPLDFEFYLRTI